MFVVSKFNVVTSKVIIWSFLNDLGNLTTAKPSRSAYGCPSVVHCS